MRRARETRRARPHPLDQLQSLRHRCPTGASDGNGAVAHGAGTYSATGINKAVGDQVRGLRKARGMTQRRLAYEAGLSVDQVGKIERRSSSPTVTTLAQIAVGLGVPVVRLLELCDEGIEEPDPLVAGVMCA